MKLQRNFETQNDVDKFNMQLVEKNKLKQRQDVNIILFILEIE